MSITIFDSALSRGEKEGEEVDDDDDDDITTGMDVPSLLCSVDIHVAASIAQCVSKYVPAFKRTSNPVFPAACFAFVRMAKETVLHGFEAERPQLSVSAEEEEEGEATVEMRADESNSVS